MADEAPISLPSILMPARGYREAVLQAAVSQLGARNLLVEDYWRGALGVDWHGGVFPPQWCGAFDLWCLKQAGLALHKDWKIGLGFLLTQPDCLFVIKTPLPGDTSYKGAPFQHHAIVERLEPSLRSISDPHNPKKPIMLEDTIVHTIDGNQGPPLYIKRNQHWLSDPAYVHFSISPLIDAAQAQKATSA